MSEINGLNGVGGVSVDSNKTSIQKTTQNQNLEMTKLSTTKKITHEDTEKALNEPRTGKAVLGLLEKSPVGFSNQQSGEEIENLGYTFYATAFHPGAPKIYKDLSCGGGTITVYNGQSAVRGEDERKTVYQNDHYKQEMFYDEKGKLTKCEIRIIDGITGRPDPNGMLTMLVDENGERTFIR